MDYLTEILLGVDPLSPSTPTLQYPKPPPTSPTNLVEVVLNDRKLLGVCPQHTPNNPQQIPNKPNNPENVGDVGSVLEQIPNTFSPSETVENQLVGDVGGGLGVMGSDLWTRAHLELF